MILGKYSFGIGDRFACQGIAQLKAVLKARNLGVSLVPVWNKSFREHQIIGTHPDSVRTEAMEAVSALGYEGQYFVDADHINLKTVDSFLEASDFYTLDLASFIGQKTDSQEQIAVDKRARAIACLKQLGREVEIPGLTEALTFTETFLEDFLDTYQLAIESAAELYEYIASKKGADNIVPEVSMDEVENPQTPKELLLILALIAEYKIPVQTLAPKFSGRFNKGVDYVGNTERFRNEFEADLLVIKYAIKHFGLPENLKLSIHSGSDKFKIYPIIGELIRKYDMGIHIKTAGTTWLEEIIGLSLADEETLAIVKRIYTGAFKRMDELCGPYSDVIDIDPMQLPATIDDWTGEKIANTLRHIPDHPDYNSSIRQLFHVGYKLAAELGEEYTCLLEEHADIIGQQVEENLYERHITRLFTLNS